MRLLVPIVRAFLLVHIFRNPTLCHAFVGEENTLGKADDQTLHLFPICRTSLSNHGSFYEPETFMHSEQSVTEVV